MQPVAFAANVDAGFIRMHKHGCGKFGLCPSLKSLQPLIGFFVEVEDRADTDRYVHLILEMIPDSIIGDQLVLGHIDGIGLQVEAILNRSAHSLRESGDKSIPLIVFKNLCAVFSHVLGEVDINDLSLFLADLMILRPLGQSAAIDLYLGDFIGVIDRLQGRTVMAFLSSRLSIAFSALAGFLPVGICGWRLATVLAVECRTVEQQSDQKQQDFQCRAQCGRQAFFFTEKFSGGVDGSINVNIVYLQCPYSNDLEQNHYRTGFQNDIFAPVCVYTAIKKVIRGP